MSEQCYKQSSLYLVATPIGNLEDITYRAVKALREADVIFCEDTRVSRKLLVKYQISGKPLFSYHQHSRQRRYDQAVEILRQGKSLALLTDAGTPGISDPGNELVAYVRQALKKELAEGTVKITPLPGPSAFLALAAASGVNLQQFVFLGFPPHKKGRRKFFSRLAEKVKEGYPVFYYESPYRLLKNWQLLQEMKPDAKVIVGRELTKKFEEIKEGALADLVAYYTERGIKGELVVLVVP